MAPGSLWPQRAVSPLAIFLLPFSLQPQIVIYRERHAVMSNAITPQTIKALREKTGAGMMECKAALTEAEGIEEKAIEILRKRGLASATKKAGRVAAEGLVHSYIHAGGKIGVLVEVNCETDFVARGEEFRTFVHDLAMHITSSEPRFNTKEDVPPAVLEETRDCARTGEAGAQERRQASTGSRQDSRRPHEQVLSGGVSDGTAFRKGPEHNHRPVGDLDDFENRREHKTAAVY